MNVSKEFVTMQYKVNPTETMPFSLIHNVVKNK